MEVIVSKTLTVLSTVQVQSLEVLVVVVVVTVSWSEEIELLEVRLLEDEEVDNGEGLEVVIVGSILELLGAIESSVVGNVGNGPPVGEYEV